MPITIKCEKELEPNLIVNEMNNFLPNDIKIKSAKKVDENFEVRYMVKEKRYRYLINLKGDGDKNYYYN